MDLLGICLGIKCGTIVAVFSVMAGISCCDTLCQSSSYQQRTVVSTGTGKKHCQTLPKTANETSFPSFLTVCASFRCRCSSSPTHLMVSPSAPFRRRCHFWFPLISIPAKWVRIACQQHCRSFSVGCS